MANKCETRCWNCGSTAMENKGNFFQCSDCGATWNDLPEEGCLARVNTVVRLETKTGTVRMRTGGVPKRLARATAKARESYVTGHE